MLIMFLLNDLPHSISYWRFGCKAGWKRVNLYIEITETSIIFILGFHCHLLRLLILPLFPSQLQMTFKFFLLFSAFLAQMPWWQCLVSPPPLICSHSSSVSFWALPPHAATSVWKCCTCAVEKIQPNEHVHLFFSVVSLAAERPGSLRTSSTVPRFHSGFRKVHTLLQPSQIPNYSYLCCCLISFLLFSLLVLISDLKNCLPSDLVGFRWRLSTVEFGLTPHVLKILIINIDCST